MDIVRVIPLIKMPATAPATLDYFWTTPLPQGSIARAPLGRRTIAVMVLESLDIRQAKLSLKKSAFTLKKLTSIITEVPQVTATQLALAQWMSVQYAASLATCLRTIAPPFLGKRGKLLTLPILESQEPLPKPSVGRLLLTQPDTARKELERIIRTTDGQVLVVLPELSLANMFGTMLGASHVVHSGMTTRQFEAAYHSVLDGSARLVVGTRRALLLPWPKLRAIVVEDPLHDAYKNDMAPRFNTPDLARHLAALSDATITWLTPSISTVHHHLIATGTLTCDDRKPYWPHITFVPMEQENAQNGRTTLFSRHAQEALLDAYESRVPLLVLSARRGYTTIARCAACRASLPCPNCTVPMRWHRTSEDMLVCYHCTAYQQVPKQCSTCHAGALRPAGLAGSQKLAEAINVILDRFGHSKLAIPILDSDLVRTDADELDILAKFDAMEHPLLVASPMVFSHRYNRTFTTVIVPQLDAMAYNPDFRTQERLIAHLEKTADFHPRNLIVQSWQDHDTLGIVNRQWDAFYRSELADRKALLWPPFTRIVRLSIRHRHPATAARMATIAADRLNRAIVHVGAKGTKLLGPNPALVERASGQWNYHLILKSTMTGPRLTELLGYVPAGWLVDVDPRSIT